MPPLQTERQIMFALILSICMSPINVAGQETGPEICEESHISVHKTLKQCVMNMDKQIAATKRSVLAPFDWQYSCERTK